MKKYLINITTTLANSDWYEADSEEEALEKAKLDYENWDAFGDIEDVDFEVWEEYSEKEEE